jgi:integrase
MLDAALRPDECYRLKPENVRDGAICIFDGKTKAARRRIPIMTERLRGALEMRLAQTAPGAWLFPADTKSGHIQESSLKKAHAESMQEAMNPRPGGARDPAGSGWATSGHTNDTANSTPSKQPVSN